jgi:hypothetical protein
MEKRLPIEEGCVAMLIGYITAPEVNGTMVVVGKCLGLGIPTHPTGEVWHPTSVIEHSHKVFWVINVTLKTKLGISIHFSNECNMLRIDNYQPDREDMEFTLAVNDKLKEGMLDVNE